MKAHYSSSLITVIDIVINLQSKYRNLHLFYLADYICRNNAGLKQEEHHKPSHDTLLVREVQQIQHTHEHKRSLEFSAAHPHWQINSFS